MQTTFVNIDNEYIAYNAMISNSKTFNTYCEIEQAYFICHDVNNVANSVGVYDYIFNTSDTKKRQIKRNESFDSINFNFGSQIIF